MRLLTALAANLLAMTGLHGVAVHAQDVGGWLPPNAPTVMSGPVVSIERRILGSGQPHAPGFENAVLVLNDIYHAPQYLPGYPTSASIWARVIDVACRREAETLRCTGYNWSPSMGRGEYLYFRPVLVAVAAPVALEEPRPVIRAPAVVRDEPAPPPPPPRPYRN